jgi:valyl-tRNA synthetase
MAKELPKTYDFSETEAGIYQWWWEAGYFKPAMIPIRRF